MTLPPDSYLGVLRRLVGARRLIVPAVRAIIPDPAGRILFQKRGDLGIWGLPAGCVEIGDSALTALAREVKEETGLDVLSAQPFALYSGPEHHFTYPNGDQVQAFEIAFIVDRWQGRLHIDGQETLDLAFFPLDQLPDPMPPSHRESIDDYRGFTGRFIVK